MFDNIGVHHDPDANRRGAASVLLTSVLTTCGGGTLALLGALVANDIKPPNLEPGDDIIPVEMFAEPDDEFDDFEAPAAPRAPIAKEAAPAPEPEEEPVERPPEPEELNEKIQELDKHIELPPATTQRESGDGDAIDGVEDGSPDGVATGIPGGSSTGVPGLGSSGGRRIVHHQDINWKRQHPKPDYPSTARGMGLGEQVCVAELQFDARGQVERVRVDHCPNTFHEAVQRALRLWTVYPPRVGKTRLPSQTRIKVRFIER